MKALIAALAVALVGLVPAYAARPELHCQPVLKADPDCTLSGYFKSKGQNTLVCNIG